MAGNAPLRSANAECKTIDPCMAERQHDPSAFGLSNYCRSVAPMAVTLRASSGASTRPDSKSSMSATVIFAGVSKSSAAEIPAGVPVVPEHSPASASSRHSPSSSGQGACAGCLTRAGAGVGDASRALPPSLAPLATELPPPFLRALLLDLRVGVLLHGLAQMLPRLLNGHLSLAHHAGDVPDLDRLLPLLGRERIGDE